MHAAFSEARSYPTTQRGIKMYRKFKQHEKFKAIPVITLSSSAKKASPYFQNTEYSTIPKFQVKPEEYLFKPLEPKPPINKTTQYNFEKLPKNRLGEKTNVIEDWLLYLPLRNQYRP
jgi:hypothetical protein